MLDVEYVTKRFLLFPLQIIESVVSFEACTERKVGLGLRLPELVRQIGAHAHIRWDYITRRHVAGMDVTSDCRPSGDLPQRRRKEKR